MAKDYRPARRSADRRIAKAGAPSAILRASAGGGTAWNPEDCAPTRFETTAVVLEYDVNELKGSRVLGVDKRALVSAEPLKDMNPEPQAGDALEVAGVVYQIVNVMPLRPATTSIFYDMQVKK